MKIGKNYHDVVVFVDNIEYPMSNKYGIELSCTRVGGWVLYYKLDKTTKIIGGEYLYTAFRIEINGVIICENKESKKLRKLLRKNKDTTEFWKKLKEKNNEANS